MSQVDFLGKAIEIVKQATEQDSAGNFEEAYKLYQNSLEYFMTAMKYEKNEKLKDAIRKKFTDYLERAEKLKEFINKVLPIVVDLSMNICIKDPNPNATD